MDESGHLMENRPFNVHMPSNGFHVVQKTSCHLGWFLRVSVYNCTVAQDLLPPFTEHIFFLKLHEEEAAFADI